MVSGLVLLFISTRLTPVGRMSTSAGNKVIEYSHANVTPMATRLPKSWNGGESLKFRLKNPKSVVALVRNTGDALSRRLDIIALCLFSPLR